MPARITDTGIGKAAREATLTGARKDIPDGFVPGLWLRLTPAGSKSWSLQCRDRHGQMRRFPLGAYPALGISEARDAARKLRAEIAEGADPIAARRRDRMLARIMHEGWRAWSNPLI